VSGQYHVELRPRSLRYYTMESRHKTLRNVLLYPESGNAQRKMRCPLWVISGHFAAQTSCPLYPRKRTLIGDLGMSAKVPKADIRWTLFD
jgi:hypothetical protein